MDCRVTPKRPASRSRDSIIQVGKSTFTRLVALDERLAWVRSRYLVRSSPCSNLWSKLFAFIESNLLYSRPANRDDPDSCPTIGDYSGPGSVSDLSDDEKPRLVFSTCWNFQTIWVMPEVLGSDKTDSMLLLVRLALGLVKLERDHGIETILFSGVTSRSDNRLPPQYMRGFFSAKRLSCGAVGTLQLPPAALPETRTRAGNLRMQKRRRENSQSTQPRINDQSALDSFR